MAESARKASRSGIALGCAAIPKICDAVPSKKHDCSQQVLKTGGATRLLDLAGDPRRVVDELGSVSIEDPPRTPDFEELRWFPLPGEVLAELRGVEPERRSAEVAASVAGGSPPRSNRS
jgi:hypothetical protein